MQNLSFSTLGFVAAFALSPLLGRAQSMQGAPTGKPAGEKTVTQIQSSQGQQEQQQDQQRADKPAILLNQAQALDLAKTIQSYELQAGELAQEKGKQASVTTLAAQLEKDQKDLGQALSNFEKRAKVTPEASPARNSLERTWQTRIDSLKKLKKGSEFDRAFLDHEIKFHQEALQLLQTGGRQAAQDPELKKVLMRAEAEMKTHLQRAQYVQQSYANEGIHY